MQIAAVSLDQTKNTVSLFPAMISRELREEFGLDVNKTIIYTRAGGQIEAVTASPFALEGKRPTFVLKNETQWWLENNAGHAMAGVIAGNVDKAAFGGCRVLSICNAHVPGLESDAEWDWDAYEKVVAGQAIDTGMLYDSIEAPPDTPVSEIPSPDVDPKGFEAGVEALRAGMEIARGDAVWLDIETLIASILDIRNPITESRRKFLNQILASEDSWIAPYEWDSCHVADLRPLAKKDRITLGFDGSKSGDWTALVACQVDDGALFLIRAWNPARYGGEVPRQEPHHRSHDHRDRSLHFMKSRGNDAQGARAAPEIPDLRQHRAARRDRGIQCFLALRCGNGTHRHHRRRSPEDS